MGRSAPVDGFVLEYDRAGSGTPVLVLHGWPGDREDFAAVAGLLDADVVRPDLRAGAGRRVLEPSPQQEFWYQAFHQLELAEQLVDGRPDAVRAYLRHFWTHWSGPDFVPTDARLDALTSDYGAPGAFTASIGWYRAGSAMVARSLAEQPPAHRITVPTTVLWPEHDPLFPRAWSDRLDEWFTDVDLRTVDGVGHFVPVEAPDVFAAAIDEHL
jgi:pimeloyl-ACP methyl ester carboxylesterase